MAKIHIDTDAMRDLAQCFYNVNEYLEDQTIPAVKSGIGKLDSDWSGQSRATFESDFQDWETYAQRLAEYGEKISKHLYRTADAFDTADQQA